MIPNQQNQNFNNFKQQYQPQFKLIAKGRGIDQNEYTTIIKSSMKAYLNKLNPLSTSTANLIKNGIGGEWFVFICPINVTNYDFNLSIVTGADFLSFYVDNFHFQICRIRD